MKNGFKIVPRHEQKMRLRQKLVLAAGLGSIVGLIIALIMFFNFAKVNNAKAAKTANFQGGGFETGLTGWVAGGEGKWDVTAVPAEFRSGSKAAQLTTLDNKEGKLFNPNYVIEVPAKDKYFITVMAFSLASHCKNEVAVGLVKSSDGTIFRSRALIADSTWQRVENTFEVENGEKYYPVLFAKRGNSGPMIHINFDDVVMYISRSEVADIIAPPQPSDVIVSVSGTNVPLQWKENLDNGSGNKGSLILRADGIQTSNKPVIPSQSLYTVGTTVGDRWKVVYYGDATKTYSDKTDAATSYTYLIYSTDLACNYSTPLSLVAVNNNNNNQSFTLPAANITSDAFYIAPNSSCTLRKGATLAVKNATIEGTFINYGNYNVLNGGYLKVAGNATYIHKGTSAIPAASWAKDATCLVNGPASPAEMNTPLAGLGQEFYNLSWDCASQTASSLLSKTIIKGTFEVRNTGKSTISIQDSVKIRGNFRQFGGNISFYGNNSYLVFEGSAGQELVTQGGTRSGTINLAVNKTAGIVNLGNSFSLNGKLALQNGNLALGNNDLTLTGTNAITTYSHTSFIITDGTGFLRQQKLGNTGTVADVWFPVGSSAESFTPTAIKNTGATDEFKVRVHNKVYNIYNSDNLPDGPEIAANVVDKTWIIAESVKGGSDATVTTQWNADDEAAAFNRLGAYISHFTEGKWNGNIPEMAMGSGPYQLSFSGVTSFSPFSVGDGNVLSPRIVTIIAFTAKLESADEIKLDWRTDTKEEKNKYFDVERSNDGKNWEKVASLPGNSTVDSKENYSYIDKTSLLNTTNEQAIAFYRIRRVDENGRIEYSQTRKISSGGVNGIITAANPADAKAWYSYSEDKVFAKVINTASRALRASLINIEGKSVVSQQIAANNSSSEIIFDMKSLSKGIYTIILEGGEKTRALKVVKN